jgi:ATP-binding cassette subfamily B protein
VNTLRKSSLETSAIKSLLRLARPFRRDYLAAVIAFFMKDSPSWILPVITALVIDTVVANGPLSSLLVLGVIAILVLAQNYPMNMIYVKRSSRATRSIAFELRTTLTEHLQKVTINFHQRVSGSVIQTKIVRDVENIELMIQQSLPIALSGGFSLVGALIVLAFNVPLFLLVFALVIPLGVGLVVLFRKKSRVQNEEFRSQVERFSTQVGELSSMLPVVRAHAIEATAKQWVNESAEQLRKKGVELDWLNGRFGALAWLSYQVLGVLSLIFAASVAILNIIPITPGQVVLVATYFGVMMGTAIGLLNVLPSLAKGIESVHSIEELLASDELERNEGKARVDDISGSLSIKNLLVDFGHKPVLDAISLDIPAKSTFAFVGPSGSGKTTLLHAILGLSRPSAGDIYFDNHAMSQVDMRSIRRHLAYVPQESVILDGSLRDNVALGLLADDGKIERALAQANLSELVRKEGGLDQVIGRSGIRLSVGQRQRLAIARALYREPKILVLDEATSALDMESERFIQKTLADLAHEITIIVVAHRLSTVQGADKICYLEAGRIIETGTHEQLMKKRGRYYKMVVGKEMN